MMLKITKPFQCDKIYNSGMNYISLAPYLVNQFFYCDEIVQGGITS